MTWPMRTSRAPSACMRRSAASIIAGCAMVAFGGGGPLHAARIARKLRVPRVIFPRGARRDVGLRHAVRRPGLRDGAGLPARPRHGRGKRVCGRFSLISTRRPRRRSARPAPCAGTAALRHALSRPALRHRGRAAGRLQRTSARRWKASFSERYREIFHTNLAETDRRSSAARSRRARAAPRHISRPARKARSRVARLGSARGPAYFPATGGLVDCCVLLRSNLRPGTLRAGAGP